MGVSPDVRRGECVLPLARASERLNEIEVCELPACVPGGVQEAEGVVCNGVGGIEWLRDFERHPVLRQARILGRIPVTVEAMQHAVILVKSARDRARVA